MGPPPALAMFRSAPSKTVLSEPLIVRVPPLVPTSPLPLSEPICWLTLFRLRTPGLLTVTSVVMGSRLADVLILNSPSLMMVLPM